MLTHIDLSESANKKRVLIIGDSVSGGMGVFYKQLLPGFTVHRLSTDCPVTDKYYFCILDFALLQARQSYDVICFTPCIDYSQSPKALELALSSVVKKIKSVHLQAKLVFVAHTMVNPQAAGKDKNLKIYGCNKQLQVLSSETGGVFVDLGTLSERLVLDHTADGVLFTDAGYKKLAFEVIKYIK